MPTRFALATLATLATLALLAAGPLAAAPHHAQAAVTAAPSAVREVTDMDETLQAVHRAGIYGTYSAVRNGAGSWEGAAGVADVETSRPVTPQMLHRVGSVTKTFTAVAILQLAGERRIDLDAPAVDYLPELVAEGLDPAVSVRMLLNHTSGLAEYLPAAFPSLVEGSAASLRENRFVEADPRYLVRLGLGEPVVGAPGERFFYSNTNYIIAGLLLEGVTGAAAERYITEHVIQPAGLENTSFPANEFIDGPHSRMYESMHGLIDPPRDYSVYHLSWGWTAGALVAPMEDLNRFYAALFNGTLLKPAQLAQMLTTVPIEDAPPELAGYGLGISPWEFSCGTFWGHTGSVLGAGTVAFASADGDQQVAIGVNLERYQALDAEGEPILHPADTAILKHLDRALCGTGGTMRAPATTVPWLTPATATFT